MLYNIFIEPLVIILRSIYLCINYFAGDLGISLMILSVVMNILLRPFTLWAARIQDKERRIQNILSPQIAEIKQNFHGVEQHEELSALYQRYSYNPVYAIRSGLDLFVQLLPLMAAYIMLSELDILKGVSFFGIKDLSRPDALLAGINILPFVMTIFNVLAAITTRKFTKRERIQAFIIAALFLVMLYNAPSALLIYWTTNNFIMLLKNINLSGIISGEKISGFMNYRFEPVGWKKIFINAFIFLILLGFLVSFLSYVYISYADVYYLRLDSIKTLHDIYIFAFMPFAVTALMFYLKFLSGGFTVKEFMIKTFCYIIFTVIAILFIKIIMFSQEYFHNKTLFIFMISSYIISAFLLPISSEKICSFASHLTTGRKNSLFFSSLIFCVIFICVFYPSLLYFTDPDFFIDSFINTVMSVSVYGMTLLFALILIWPLIPELLQNIFAFMAAFLVCTAFINSFVLTESYGNINALQIDDRTMTISRALTRDIISFVITCIIMTLCICRKYIKHLITAFILISFAMCGVSIYCYFNIRHDNKSQLAENINFPEYHNRFWRFSRTGQNVICLFLDGFTGDHVIKILAENPDLIKKFDGFTYFPDNMSTGSWTFFSTPAIYGGPSYEPALLNKTRPNVTLEEKFTEAFSFMPNIFTSNDYDVVLTAPFLKKNNLISKLKHPDSVLCFDYAWNEDYVPHWLKWAEENDIAILKKDNSDISRFLLVLSLFRTAPFSIRSKLYSRGTWMGGSSQALKTMLLKSFIPDLAVIQFMDKFIQVDDGKSTFKVIYNHLSHPSCFLEANSLQLVMDPYPDTDGQTTLVNGLYPEHYYTEVHVMNFIANFIAALKNAGVYDNTRIVLVSDHDFADCWQLNINPAWKKLVYNWPNALLMFKDFDSYGDLITSNALMSIEDTPALLIAGIAEAPGIYTLEELKKLSSSDRIRIHCGHSLLKETSTLYSLDGGVYQVKGTMFKPENWTKIE